MIATRAFGKRISDVLARRDDVVWSSLQRLGSGALAAARLLEQRLEGVNDSRLGEELRASAETTDETLRRLNRHLHNAFSSPLERDDALALAAAFDRVAQTSADIGLALDARGAERGRHEARRAAALLTGAVELVVVALAELAAGRSLGDAPTDARGLVAQGRDVVRQGLHDVLSAQLPMQQLLSWKDVYDRLDAALGAARDAERLVDALELRRK